MAFLPRDAQKSLKPPSALIVPENCWHVEHFFAWISLWKKRFTACLRSAFTWGVHPVLRATRGGRRRAAGIGAGGSGAGATQHSSCPLGQPRIVRRGRVRDRLLRRILGLLLVLASGTADAAPATRGAVVAAAGAQVALEERCGFYEESSIHERDRIHIWLQLPPVCPKVVAVQALAAEHLDERWEEGWKVDRQGELDATKMAWTVGVVKPTCGARRIVISWPHLWVIQTAGERSI